MKKRGSVLGGMLLVAGSCIGAGMLALPILTGLAGFFPSLITMLVAWGFMTFTGLLLVEAYGWFHKRVNLVSMAKEALGRWGGCSAWGSYLFLFYSLLVAYTSVSGSIFSALFDSFLGIKLSPRLASVFFTLFFGCIIYLGTRWVDLWNRMFMAGLILAYLAMMGMGIFQIDPALLERSAPKYMFLSLPVLVISFGFQNMIPSLSDYLGADLKRVRWTIIGGGLITLAIYFFWALFVMGLLPFSQIHASYLNGEDATAPLRNVLKHSSILYFSQMFAFFAIVTSFLAQGLTLLHFIADGLGVGLRKKNLWWLTLLALGPPLLFAFFDPSIFFKALGFAGGICAMILFGILPVSMVWVERYKNKRFSSYCAFGGKIALGIAFCFALFVIGCEIGKVFQR